MDRAIVLDLETTSVDTLTTEVVQCALLPIALPAWGIGTPWVTTSRPSVPIPRGASEVHGIYDADVRDRPHFSTYRDEIGTQIASADLLITFNGEAFDLPIIRRLLGLALDAPHFDVYRAWQVARGENLESPHGGPGAASFTGSLGSAFAWLSGREPENAHDAGVDCRMTAGVAHALASHYGLAQCVSWTSGALPGAVDWAGKIVWDGARPVLSFSKHKGKSLQALTRSEPGFLRWMLRSDFHAGTKEVITAALDGRFPVCNK